MRTVILLGRTTKDPEIRYTQENKPVAGFTLAINGRRDGDEALFIDCSAFGGTAEFVQKYVSKGTKVAIQGELTPDNYTAKDGTQVHKIRVIVQNIEFAESKSQNQAASTQNQVAPSQNQVGPSQNQVGSSQNQVGPSQNQVGPSQNQVGPSQNQAGSSQNQAAASPNIAAPMNMQAPMNMGTQPQMPPMNMGIQMSPMPNMNMAPNMGYMGTPMGMPQMMPPMQSNPFPVGGGVPVNSGFTGFDASNYDPNLPFN